MPTYILVIDDLFRVDAPTEAAAERVLLERLGTDPYVAYDAIVVDVEDDADTTDRDPFGEDLVAIAHTLQVLSAEYGLRDIQEPAQFPDCATTLVETFRAGILWHHLEAAVAAEFSGEAHGRGMHSARTDAR
jgi:hypothetical protein